METRNAIYFRKPDSASRRNSAYRHHAENVETPCNAFHRRIVEIVKDKHPSDPEGLRSRISDAFASTPSRNGSAARVSRPTAQSKEKSSVAQEAEGASISTAKWYHRNLPRILDEAKQRQDAYRNKLLAKIYSDFETGQSQAAKFRNTRHDAALPQGVFRPSAQVFDAQKHAWQTNACTDFTRDPREAEIQANRKIIERFSRQSAARERVERPMSREEVDAFVNQGWGRLAASHAVTHKRINSCLGQTNRTIIIDRDETSMKPVEVVRARPLNLPPRARTPAPHREDKAFKPLDMVRKEPPVKAAEVVIDILDDMNDAREVFEATAGNAGIGLPVKFSFLSGFFNGMSN